MRRSRYTEPEILEALKKHSSGYSIAELSKAYGISTSTFYEWKVRFGVDTPAELSTLQRLQKENRRLRRRIAEMLDETDKLKGLIRRDQSLPTDCH